jgi:hypothetical protein
MANYSIRISGTVTDDEKLAEVNRIFNEAVDKAREFGAISSAQMHDGSTGNAADLTTSISEEDVNRDSVAKTDLATDLALNENLIESEVKSKSATKKNRPLDIDH